MIRRGSRLAYVVLATAPFLLVRGGDPVSSPAIHAALVATMPGAQVLEVGTGIARTGSGARNAANDPPTRERRGERPERSRPTSPARREPPPPSSIHLDEAPPEVVRRRLTRAVAAKQARRDFYMGPALIDRVARERRVRVIFDATAGTDTAGLAALLSGGGRAARWDDLRLFPLLETGAASVGPQALLHLIEASGVGRIEPDALHRPSLRGSVPLVGAATAHREGYDGEGAVIAILDTGIDPDHPFIGNRVVDEACFSAGRDCPNGQPEMLGPGAGIPCDFGCGHGTAVAGVAAGRDPASGRVGIAPAARLISIQIFSEIQGSPAAYSSDILAGLQHVLYLSRFYSIAAANLSIGGDLYTSEAACDRAVSSQRNAAARLREAGIATIAATGNESRTDRLPTPACLSTVIGVGSSSDTDTASTFSNSAPFLSFLAPGETIESARQGGGYRSRSGTSMSAPHVAGAFALIREAFPDAGVPAVENALKLTGVPILDPRNGVTSPRIAIAAAIEFLDAYGIEAPARTPGDGASIPTGLDDSAGADGGSACGLLGLELTPVLALAFARKRRRGRLEPGPG